MAAKAEKVRNIKIAIADDHQLFREAMVALIKELDYLKVICEAADGEELLKVIKEKMPDIVLMDLEMPGMDGMDATAVITKKYPDVKVIALTQYPNEKLISHMMKQGARAYLLKDCSAEHLEDVIWMVMEKGHYYTENVSEAMRKGLQDTTKRKPGFNPASQLTKREKEVLQLVGKGLTSAQIGERLFTSASTVDKQRKSLRSKSGAKNTAQLILWAKENKLLD